MENYNSYINFANGSLNIAQFDESCAMEVDTPMYPMYCQDVMQYNHMGAYAPYGYNPFMPAVPYEYPSPPIMHPVKPQVERKCKYHRYVRPSRKYISNAVTRKRMARLGIKRNKCAKPQFAPIAAFIRFMIFYFEKHAMGIFTPRVATRAARAWTRLPIAKKLMYNNPTRCPF